MQVSARGKSQRLQRVLTDFGAEHSFAAGCARLREHYGLRLNASAVRTVTLPFRQAQGPEPAEGRHAQRAARTLAARYQESFRILPAEGAGAVVAEADGTMICTVEPGRARRGGGGDKRGKVDGRAGPRPRQWKEMRLLAAQAQGSVQTSCAATFGSVAEAGRRWGHCTREAGWGLRSRIHVVADGAEWISLQSREVFGTQASVLTDFYHVSEYLAAAGQVCRAEAPRTWLHTQQKRLKRGALDSVLAELEAHLEPDTVPDEAAPVRAALRYLGNRRDALDYAGAIARELPIGSGLIESGHKHVLHTRLKGAGTAWLPAHADALAQLRVLRVNQQWDAFWPPTQPIPAMHHN